MGVWITLAVLAIAVALALVTSRLKPPNERRRDSRNHDGDGGDAGHTPIVDGNGTRTGSRSDGDSDDGSDSGGGDGGSD